MIGFDKFTKMFSVICITILLFIAGFNYYMDPAGIFNNRKVDIAVNYLVQGKAVAGLTNFDERIFKKELIIKTNIKPDTIVFGSSRAMGIISEFDKDKNSFGNYSVSGANFNDDIALFDVYFEKYHEFPKKVILAVEPWNLNKNRGDTRWKSLEREYYNGLKLLNFNDEKIKEYNNIDYILEKTQTLFSISYLRNSIKELQKNERMPEAINETANVVNAIILSNGSLKYGSGVNKLTVEEIRDNAKSYINGNRIYQLDDFNELEKVDIDKFIRFIDFLSDNNVDVILYFPPYHPYVYNYISNSLKFKNVLEAEKFFINTAEKYSLKIYGSYNPKVCGVDENDFSDGMHLRTSGYGKVFKEKF